MERGPRRSKRLRIIRGEDGGNNSYSDGEVDHETFTQMKRRVEVMEKENEELKTALVLKEDLLKQSLLEKENMKNLVKSKEYMLEQFQLKKDNMADMVKCPVCLMLPRENKPVPCCPRGHFVCSTCKDRLTRLLYGLNFICLSLSRNVIFDTPLFDGISTLKRALSLALKNAFLS